MRFQHEMQQEMLKVGNIALLTHNGLWSLIKIQCLKKTMFVPTTIVLVTYTYSISICVTLLAINFFSHLP